MRLDEAVIGKKYIISSIDKENVDALKKICSMGMLPGTEVSVLQKKPAILFQVYNSRFTMDNQLAEKINIKEI